MKKSQRICIFVISICSAIILVLGICFGMYQYFNQFNRQKELPIGHGQKVSVILLAGQSNAVGCSLNQYLQKNVSRQKYKEYQNGYDKIYINHYTGYNESKGFIKTSTNQGETDDYFGPEVGLAEKLHEMYPDEFFIVIKYAWSGTNLYEQWLSPSSTGNTGPLYQGFVQFVKQNINDLNNKGYSTEIVGMCWMQGESDSATVESATNYENNLKNLINDVRIEFAENAATNGIAFIDAYIADKNNWWPQSALINQSKQNVANLAVNNIVIDSNAHGLRCDKEPVEAPDMAHYDSLSQIKLGHLFAEQVAQFFTTES